MWRSVPAEPRTERSSALFFGAALALVSFYAVGDVFLGGFTLELGSLNFPTPRYVTLVALWTIFGGASAILLALALSRLAGTPARIHRLAAEWTAISDQRFLLWTGVAAFAIPLCLRMAVLHGAPLADDESAYRFAAELLASGRLWVPSPPSKLFFDQNFMINDGRLYPVYFLGWPALLAPGVWLHATGLVNPLLSALTVPPLFFALRRLAGPSWAKAGVLLFLSSPFLQIAAATELSHTSCLMALTWCLWMYLRTQADEALTRDHAVFAFSFALAFCIRPQSALPIGLPLIVSWSIGVARSDANRRWRAALAFVVPTAALASLFLGSLWAQNGSPWRMGYTRYSEYLIENRFRFATFTALDLTAMAGFDFSQVSPAIARTAIGMFRLNADLFGWPASFAFLIVALPVLAGPTRLLWAMVGAYLSLMLFQRDWGIDTFGPLHAFELSLPIIGLTIVGARNLAERLTWAQSDDVQRPAWRWSVFPPCLLAALMATAWLGFVHVRLEAVRQVAGHVNLALRAPERAGLHRAVVFAPWPFTPRCTGIPLPFVRFRPANDPDLRNDILWVNHVSVDEDRQLLNGLAGRTGYLLRWTPQCTVSLVPLSSVRASDIPPAPMAVPTR